MFSSNGSRVSIKLQTGSSWSEGRCENFGSWIPSTGSRGSFPAKGECSLTTEALHTAQDLVLD